ncbi:DUF1330 domain-containing protein [Paracoccus suum]|uniref:DUF1330 domain-containing protein n=1 Tax=Paracoccus suum TaxID=2259340 RepID=A0A344PLZ7_9RHOB|nr:DUF1330 domain-containing protein [Paracoccus suum]AXC50402.1 DUF1330 domain-containing protein [Paracoccus suum]
MPAYVVATLNVTNPEPYRRYASVTPEVIARHGGRFLTRGGAIEVLEGAGAPQRMVLIEFPDAEAARAFYGDPLYQEAAIYRREGSENGLFLLQEGVPDSTAPDPDL